MQLSKQKLNKSIEKQIYAVFHRLVADLKKPDEVERIFKELLSPVEYQVIAKRLAIAIFLDKGRSYENIKSTLKVSSATIASVQETMGNPGIQQALRKVKADEWADEWAGKISNLMDKLLPSK